jgi:hypothetical protein
MARKKAAKRKAPAAATSSNGKDEDAMWNSKTKKKKQGSSGAVEMFEELTADDPESTSISIEGTKNVWHFFLPILHPFLYIRAENKLLTFHFIFLLGTKRRQPVVRRNRHAGGKIGYGGRDGRRADTGLIVEIQMQKAGMYEQGRMDRGM